MKITYKIAVKSALILCILTLLMQGCFNDFITPKDDDDFAASLVTNKKYYKAGEQVSLTLFLQNTTGESKDLIFNNGQIYDFVVKKLSSEEVVWRWSNGRAFTEAIWTMILEPWERKTYNAIWDQRDNESGQVSPGTYRIEALISSEPEIFAVSRKIVIEDNESDIDFQTIDNGTQSGYQRRASIVIRNQERWEEIWNLHTSNLDQIPRIPKFDFSKEMVIAIFRGEFPSSGYYTEVSGIIRQNNGIKVVITETDDIGGMVLDVITYPFHIVKLDKSDLPIEFEYRRVIK